MKTEIPFSNVLKLPQRSSPPTIVVQEPAIVQDQVNEPILKPTQQPMNPMHEPSRKSNWMHCATDRLNLMFLDDTSNEIYLDNDVPRSYEEAMQSLDCKKWQETMESKIELIKINKVWTLVEASKDIKPIGCKWVYKKIIGAYWKVETYKARLIAKGYCQKEGIDYDKTFLPWQYSNQFGCFLL